MPALTVALLGGESSGKSTLGQALTNHLNRVGVSALCVQEHLRDWCVQAGRAPLLHEQAGIASRQNQLIRDAAHSGVRVVVADTTGLVVAAYSEMYFDDSTLWPEALAFQRQVGLNLLMGLDLPWMPDGLFRDSPAIRARTDALLRRELQSAGLAFTTVYGQGEARLRHALKALGAVLGEALVPADPALENGTGRWSCDNCSDPECEHRLFTGLLAARR